MEQLKCLAYGNKCLVDFQLRRLLVFSVFPIRKKQKKSHTHSNNCSVRNQPNNWLQKGSQGEWSKVKCGHFNNGILLRNLRRRRRICFGRLGTRDWWQQSGTDRDTQTGNTEYGIRNKGQARQTAASYDIRQRNATKGNAWQCAHERTHARIRRRRCCWCCCTLANFRFRF